MIFRYVHGPSPDCDVALIKLARPVSGRRIPMCQKVFTDSVHKLILSGMGVTDGREKNITQVLQETELVEFFEGCEKDTNIAVCTRPKGQPTSGCFGDSGGPLVVLNKSGDVKCLYGVASFVDDNFCRNGTYFARVSSFEEWIKDNMSITDLV